jgi:hypothetical protein
LVGLLGWAVWVLFLVVVGVRGLKGDTSAATESLSVDPQDRSTPDAALAADAQLPN